MEKLLTKNTIKMNNGVLENLTISDYSSPSRDLRTCTIECLHLTPQLLLFDVGGRTSSVKGKLLILVLHTKKEVRKTVAIIEVVV